MNLFIYENYNIKIPQEMMGQFISYCMTQYNVVWERPWDMERRDAA